MPLGPCPRRAETDSSRSIRRSEAGTAVRPSGEHGDWRQGVAASRPSGEYAALRRLLEQKGLFAKQPVFYLTTIVLVLALLSTSLIVLTVTEGFALLLLNAVFLAFVCCQASYVVHDAGHGQIFHVPWKNHLVGILFTNAVLGMSYGSWRASHSRHHARPNQVDFDPDIEISLLAFTEEEARRKTGVRRILAKYQAYVFVPMLLFDPFRRRKDAIQFLWQQKAGTEALLLATHYALACIYLLSVLEASQALTFLLVEQACYGLFMASAFAPNHKGMPILGHDTDMDFLRRQVLTTRNVSAHPLVDLWYGSLNYQIEHHLFPTMPRNKLKESQPIVRAFCTARGIPYLETSALESYRQVLGYLHQVGASLRRGETPQAPASLTKEP